MRKLANFAAVVALVALAACAPAKRAYHRSSDDLGKAAKLYNDYVRWGYADKASEFIAPADRAAFVDWRTNLDKTMKITDVHISTTDFPKDANEATVLVTWTFYRTNQLTEQTKTLTEHWFLRDFHWFVRHEPAALDAK